MTMALCFHCGHIKMGSLMECDSCGKGKVEEDDEVMTETSIQFSDWFLSEEDLNFYSSLIKKLRSSCSDENLCYWTFFRYISLNSPSILKVKLEEEFEAKADKLLQTVKVN